MSTTREELVGKKCLPCEGGVDPIQPEEAGPYLEAVVGWSLTPDGQRIRRQWRAKNFMAAIEFFGAVADLAEDEGHHPDLHLESYRNVAVEIWTHAIGGLSENDFVLAAKIDQISLETQ